MGALTLGVSGISLVYIMYLIGVAIPLKSIIYKGLLRYIIKGYGVIAPIFIKIKHCGIKCFNDKVGVVGKSNFSSKVAISLYGKFRVSKLFTLRGKYER